MSLVYTALFMAHAAYSEIGWCSRGGYVWGGRGGTVVCGMRESGVHMSNLSSLFFTA